MRKIFIAPSMLSADFSCLDRELKKCAAAGADYIHLDVMDGHFVPNITFGAPVIAKLRSVCDLTFDVHLMISDPLAYAEDFAKAGADIIVFHLEADSDTDKTIEKIIALGCKAGIALKPGTPAEAVLPYLDRLSMVLVMTVEPGFGGQAFMADMMPKLRFLHDYCRENEMDIDLQVDGGITADTVCTASANGANVFVAGSAVFLAKDPAQAVCELRAGAGKTAL